MNSIDEICNEINQRLSVHSALMDSGWNAMEATVVSLLNTYQNDISLLKNLQVEQEASAGILAKKIDELLDGNASDAYKIVLSNGFEMKAHQNLINRLREATDTTNAEADRLENEYFALQEQVSAMKLQKKKEKDERKKKEEEDRQHKKRGKRRHPNAELQLKPIKKLRDSPKNLNKTMDTDYDNDSFWSDGDE